MGGGLKLAKRPTDLGGLVGFMGTQEGQGSAHVEISGIVLMTL